MADILLNREILGVEDFSVEFRGGMELCSLEDAFPDISKKSVASLGDSPGAGAGSGLGPSREERRAARKRAKKCKGPALDYLNQQDDVAPTDPDRPAVKRLGEVPAFTSLEDAYRDVSGTEGFKLPTLPKTNCLFSDQGLPAYFGKGLDDVDEGFIDVGSVGDRLVPPTLDASFEGKGVEKAGGTRAAQPTGDDLPAPFLEDAWKPLTPAKVRTSFFPAGSSAPASQSMIRERTEPELPTQVSRPAPVATSGSEIRKALTPAATTATTAPDRDTLLQKIQELTKRLDELEVRTRRDTQRELLLFVGAGVLLLVAFDATSRLGRRS